MYILGGLLELICILYILFILIEFKQEIPNYNENSHLLFAAVQRRFRLTREVYSSPTRDRYSQRFLKLVLISLTIEFICFSGNTLICL